MRHAAGLLLLLVLPGLLVPAGAWWHVCRCVVPMQAQPAACCAPATDATSTPSCCGSAAKPTPALPTLADDDCRCEWLSLPELGDDFAAAPAPAAAPALAAPLRCLAVVAPATTVPPRAFAWAARHQRPPPDPFAARNLPLRI